MNEWLIDDGYLYYTYKDGYEIMMMMMIIYLHHDVLDFPEFVLIHNIIE